MVQIKRLASQLIFCLRRIAGISTHFSSLSSFCFGGFVYLGRFEIEDLIGYCSHSGPFQVVRTKKRGERISSCIMMQERVMKIIASDRVPPSPRPARAPPSNIAVAPLSGNLRPSKEVTRQGGKSAYRAPLRPVMARIFSAISRSFQLTKFSYKS